MGQAFILLHMGDNSLIGRIFHSHPYADQLLLSSFENLGQDLPSSICVLVVVNSVLMTGELVSFSLHVAHIIFQ